MGKYTIQQLAEILVKKNGLNEKEAQDFVVAIFEIVKEGLEQDKLVKIKGFGTFKIIDIDPRASINVNTGERVLIEGHQKITFTPDAVMKEMVNRPFSQFETVILNDGVDLSEIDRTYNFEPVAPKAEPTKPQATPQATPVKPQPVAPKAEPTTPAKPQATPVKPQPKPKAKPAMQSSLQKEFYPSVAINYCNTKLYIDASMKGVINITSSQECAVADGYEALCRSNYKPLIANCQQAQKDFRLNDWGVFLFVKTAAEALCNDENSCIVMQQFLLNELGYRAKMARRGDRNQLLLFVATDCMVYGHPYFTKEGLNYYNINGTEACTFYMCNQDSKKAKTPVAMRLNNVPALNSGVVSRQRTNKAGNVSVSVNVSKSLMDFYASMPQCDYGVYAKAPVAGSLAQEVLGTLRPLVQGKSEVDAANLLLNFVQTGFKYATDEEQFGFEKPFFVEELFYYPACDCEDRSVLFGWLVRELLGLDVVYLDYPNHIATAVQFKGDVKGDFLTVDGKRYTVCDPTYIGASIGMTMPNLRSAGVSILRY